MSARILRRILQIWRYLLSLRLQWKTLSSFGLATSVGEGKIESKSWGVLFGEYVARWCSILLLSAHPKYVAGSTQAFATINKSSWRNLYCNGDYNRKWTWQLEFKSWMRLYAFHVALIPLGKVCIKLFSPHL